MAKLSGPEEFFEVFRHDKDQPAPSQKPEPPPSADQPPAQPAAGIGPAARPGAEKTIPVKMSTIVFAGVCVVLLMILSYIAGQANAPEKQAGTPAGAAPKQLPPPLSSLGNTGGGRQDAMPAQPERPRSQASGVELRVNRYPNDSDGEKAAIAVVKFLNTLPAVRHNAVNVGYYRDGKLIVVAIAPFESDRSPAALEVWNAVEDATFANRKPFKKTVGFGPIHQDQ